LVVEGLTSSFDISDPLVAAMVVEARSFGESGETDFSIASWLDVVFAGGFSIPVFTEAS
jgi:hypothetical protein